MDFSAKIKASFETYFIIISENVQFGKPPDAKSIGFLGKTAFPIVSHSLFRGRIYILKGGIALEEEQKSGNLIPVAVLVLCCLAFLLLSYLSYQKVGKMASNLAAQEQPIVVIDPGHGGEDGGAEGVSALLEKDINLAIAQKLEKMLSLSGFRVVMTRDQDASIGDSALDTVKERKVSDIHNRLKIIEEQGDCIFLSIHQNHFTSSQYYGTQVFYSTNDPSGQALAEAIRGRVVELLQPENTRECKPATSSIYLLWHAEVPAVLVECGFLSNESEAQRLNDPQYQEQMAFAIYTGFLDYYQAAR